MPSDHNEPYEQLYDEIRRSAENHGNAEGNEPQIGDLEQVVETLLAMLTPEQIRQARGILKANNLLGFAETDYE